MTQPIIHHQNDYEAVVAELRRVADALETVPAGFGPSYVSLNIQAGKNGQAASIDAVDAVALAVLGKKGDPRPIAGGKLHHHADSGLTPVYVAVYQQVPGPADVELERLRAEVAALKAANARLDEQATGDPVGLTYSRVDDDPQVIRPHSPRLPLGTGGVVDGGALADETVAR